MRLFTLFSLLWLLLGVSAWPRPYRLDLERRADTTAAGAASTGAASTADNMPIETGKGTQTGTGAGTGTGTGTGTASKTASTTGNPTGTNAPKSTITSDPSTSTSIDPRLPPGGISMIEPNLRETTYYRIGEFVTFAWNYTSLLITPSAVNVVASCSLNDATYTISSNMSVQQTGAVTWDTHEFETTTAPLLTATYTLIVYDVDRAIDDIPSAGELSSLFGYRFGMYKSQPYTPLNEYKCATCNAALSDLDRNALRFALGMAAITLGSFAWYAGGFGVFAT